MRKIVYDTIKFNIPIGQNAFDYAKDLRDGTCTGVKIIPYDNSARVGSISVSVQSSDTSELVGKTDYRDYLGGNGGYEESYKPCLFRTDAQVRLAILAEAAIAGTAFEGEMIFKIECKE